MGNADLKGEGAGALVGAFSQLREDQLASIAIFHLFLGLGENAGPFEEVPKWRLEGLLRVINPFELEEGFGFVRKSI